ncbi:MAG: Holliday junction resolvase RuvX [Rhodospirillales bacterium]
MPVVEPAELRSLVPMGESYMALDVGTKTIGIAVSDVSHMIASPRETIRRTKLSKDVVRLQEIVAADSVGGLVVGLPVSMDGSEGPRCQATRDITAEIMKVLDLPVAFWDERLSTAAVERVLIEGADASRKRRGEVIDKMAAGWILQGFLDGG